ncbi:MAG: hypothetical protein ACTHJ4_00585 [Candidatus Nucleicultricaceae bacterium]
MPSSSSSSAPPNVQLKDGDIVGKWRIRFTMGEGAFGEVYLVERVGVSVSG